MPSPTVETVTKHEMTPRARLLVRAGLGLVVQEYEKQQKSAKKLGDETMYGNCQKTIDYTVSVHHEYAEPGSTEADEKDQAHLFGDEGPFREDLNNIKGRP